MGRSESETFRHRGFSYWILGYQGFIEPIIRESVRMKLAGRGYRPCRERIVRKPDLTLATARMQANRAEFELTAEEVDDFDRELQRRTRLQLDLAFERDGKLIIGEVKSWAGWGAFDQKMAENAFFQGRDALLFLIHEIEKRPVESVLLAVWGNRSKEHDAIISMLELRFDTRVELAYADDLLAEHLPVETVEERIRLLREASEDVTQWLQSLTKPQRKA